MTSKTTLKSPNLATDSGLLIATDTRITADDVMAALTLVPIDSIRPHPQNNNVGDLDAISESIKELGFFDPITVQRSTGYIITGNHSWRVHKGQGATEVPALVYDVDDLTAVRMMAAHNRTNRLGHDDPAATIALLNAIVDDAGTEYALCGTGWYMDDLAELEKMCAGDAAPDVENEPDDVCVSPADDGFRTISARIPVHAHAAFYDLTEDADPRDDAGRLLHLLTRAGWDRL